MTNKTNKLTFGKGNQKLQHTALHLGMKKSHVVTFSLPAGHTCPAASLCHSRVIMNEDGKRQRVDFGEFVCYATKAEALYTNVYDSRHNNWQMLQDCKSVEEMSELLQNSLPRTAKLVRIHDSGDFFNRRYFEAWVKVAQNNPEIRFFAYTKMLPYAVKANEMNLNNFFVQYSYGGIMDSKRDSEYNAIPTCYVITTNDWILSDDRRLATNKKDGRIVKVVCDGHNAGHEDYLAIVARESFGIIVH